MVPTSKLLVSVYVVAHDLSEQVGWHGRVVVSIVGLKLGLPTRHGKLHFTTYHRDACQEGAYCRHGCRRGAR